jgi:hypothetical protein
MDTATIHIDARHYPLEAVNAALCSIVGDATPILDTDGKVISITLIPKKALTTDVINKFNACLNLVVQRRRDEEKHRELKKEIIHRALMQDCQHCFPPEEIGFDDNSLEDLEQSLIAFEQQSLEDPLGIATPWREQKR